MKYSKNSLNILTVKSYNGIGNAWIVKNLKGNETVDEIVSLLNKSLKDRPTNVDEFEQLRNDFETRILDKFSQCCDGFVAYGDSHFPRNRGVVKDSNRPVFLYYKGDINLLSHENNNISVIGLLNPTDDIENRERKIVAEFVKNGATIVSGLAFGCDSISHQQALDSNGKTIAILPSPLYNIMPASNRGLAFQIVEEGGLIVSEYGSDFKSPMELNSRYQERDRLQALFCDTIVLAASYSKNSAERWKLYGQKLDSGARLAMGYASEFGIPRAVMYDQERDEDNPMFDLNRDLIKEEKNITILTQHGFIETISNLLEKNANEKIVKSFEQGSFKFD